MKTTPYRRGYRFQQRVLQALTKAGWSWVISAGSHSPVDVVAMRRRQFVLIQVKKNGYLSPAERRELLAFGPVSAQRVVVRSGKTRQLEVRKVKHWLGSIWRPFSDIFGLSDRIG